MLNSNNHVGIINHRAITRLLFISFIFCHSIVSAELNIKEKTAEEYRVKGFTQQQKGNLNDALSNYSKAISLGVENAVVFNDMGILYEQIEIYSKAEQYYFKAIETDKDYLPAYLNLAYLYQNMGETEKAFQYFKKRFESAGAKDAWAQKAKIELLKIHPEYQNWVVTLEANKLNREIVTKAHEEFYNRVKRSNDHFRDGQNFLKQEKYRQAITEFNRALRLTPRNPKIMRERQQAMVELSKMNIKEHSEQAIKRLNAGDSISARNEIQKILATIPNEPILISK